MRETFIEHTTDLLKSVLSFTSVLGTLAAKPGGESLPRSGQQPHALSNSRHQAQSILLRTSVLFLAVTAAGTPFDSIEDLSLPSEQARAALTMHYLRVRHQRYRC